MSRRLAVVVLGLALSSCSMMPRTMSMSNVRRSGFPTEKLKVAPHFAENVATYGLVDIERALERGGFTVQAIDIIALKMQNALSDFGAAEVMVHMDDLDQSLAFFRVTSTGIEGAVATKGTPNIDSFTTASSTPVQPFEGEILEAEKEWIGKSAEERLTSQRKKLAQAVRERWSGTFDAMLNPK